MADEIVHRRWVVLAVAGLIAATAGCVANEGEEPATVGVLTDVERAAPDTGPEAHIATYPMSLFGHELFRAAVATSEGEGNIIVSPASVAIALAMIEPGAVGEAQTQLREVLHIEDAATYHASMNAIEQDLESRQPEVPSAEGEDPGEVRMRIANAAFFQEGYPFEASYLDAIGRTYGPVLRSVDYAADPDAAAHEVNRFVSDATEERIPELIADGVLTDDTVLTLVNALHLKASWEGSFDEAATVDGEFTRADGSTVAVPLMAGSADATAVGDGWIGAAKRYVGGLVVQFVLPDEGRFDEVSADLLDAFPRFESATRGPALLALPRFEVRHQAELSPALKALGLTAPYEPGNLLGIADDPTLMLDKVLHETYLAMDEEGTEAAAATASVFVAIGAPIEPPVPVVLTRPFLFRILDVRTGATLFTGQVVDPTA